MKWNENDIEFGISCFGVSGNDGRREISGMDKDSGEL